MKIVERSINHSSENGALLSFPSPLLLLPPQLPLPPPSSSSPLSYSSPQPKESSHGKSWRKGGRGRFELFLFIYTKEMAVSLFSVSNVLLWMSHIFNVKQVKKVYIFISKGQARIKAAFGHMSVSAKKLVDAKPDKRATSSSHL